MKICIAASGGGHIIEAMQLKEVWKGKDYFFISDKRINAKSIAKKEKMYFIIQPKRSYIRTLIAFIQTLLIFIRENPSVIISTGAEIGYPALILGWIFRKETIYIESLARVSSPSLCGKMVYGKVNHFFVQWPEGKKWFPNAEYAGSVFE